MMASFRLEVPDAVAAVIRSLHPDIKRRVRAGLSLVTADPSAGKALKGDLEGLWSFRIGRLRIVYRAPEGRIVELVAIGPRATIYAETLRLARRRGPG